MAAGRASMTIDYGDFVRFQRTLDVFSRRAKGVVNRRAVRAGLKPIRERMRRLAPTHKTYSKRTGRPLARRRASLLRKSIGNNGPWTYRSSGWTVAVVGPRRRYGSRIKNPSRYAHLVELGHNILERPWASRKGAPVWRHIPARPFVRPALVQTRSKTINRMREVYRAELFRLTGMGRYEPGRKVA